MPRLALVAPLLFSCVCAATSARAQDVAGESPAHISVVDGAALLERDGRAEPAPRSMPLLAGDRVRTQDGRVEILFNEGSTLHLDSNSVVDFQSDEVIRLLNGRVRLNIMGTMGTMGANRRVAYRVDAPFAWVEVARVGEYRISVYDGSATDGRGADVELAVLRGAADLVNEDGRRPLGAGERAFARAGAAPSAQYVFNSASWDEFDRWSEARRDSRLGVSAEYLPQEVQAYASTFNQHGSWQNEPTYGHVWYPRAHVGWRPYFYGSWTTLRPWGWTWIGSDPWAWPTHHFGRWGFSPRGWFWIPGRTWGPAWVSWAHAPGFVSWCPLGWNNRAVFGFGFNAGWGGGFRHNSGWPRNGWTVVPHRGFGRGFVNVNVVNSTRIDVRTRNAFVVRDAGPDVRGYAVPRASVPIRSVGGRSVGAPGGVGVGVVNGTSAVNGAASRGARTRTAPGTTAAADSDPTAAFRSRRSSSAPLSSSGYPAPARTRSGAVPAIPDATAGVVSESRSGAVTSRRAVPRGSDGVAPSTPSATSGAPSRRAPEYRSTPDAYSPGTSSRPEVYRAVPRSERPAADIYSPAPSYGGAPGAGPARSYRVPSSPNMPSMPSQQAPDRSRAMPRPGSDGGGSPSGSRAPERSQPGGGAGSRVGPPQRSAPAPSGPPPQSAAPSRPSGPPSGSSSGGESRSRSGGQSSGRAVPRGGRG
jgi:hypothetical protein